MPYILKHTVVLLLLLVGVSAYGQMKLQGISLNLPISEFQRQLESNGWRYSSTDEKGLIQYTRSELWGLKNVKAVIFPNNNYIKQVNLAWENKASFFDYMFKIIKNEFGEKYEITQDYDYGGSGWSKQYSWKIQGGEIFVWGLVTTSPPVQNNLIVWFVNE